MISDLNVSRSSSTLLLTSHHRGILGVLLMHAGYRSLKLCALALYGNRTLLRSRLISLTETLRTAGPDAELIPEHQRLPTRHKLHVCYIHLFKNRTMSPTRNRSTHKHTHTAACKCQRRHLQLTKSTPESVSHPPHPSVQKVICNLQQRG